MMYERNSSLETLKSCLLYGVGTIVLVLMILGCILASQWYQLNVDNPIQRKLILNDPQRTINLRADFHNKLTEIITADNNILGQIGNIQDSKQSDPTYKNSQSYKDDKDQLNQLITIRSNAISSYNEQARSTDTSVWDDNCMPHHINDTLTINYNDLSSMIGQITDEKNFLNQLSSMIPSAGGLCSYK